MIFCSKAYEMIESTSYPPLSSDSKQLQTAQSLPNARHEVTEAKENCFLKVARPCIADFDELRSEVMLTSFEVNMRE